VRRRDGRLVVFGADEQRDVPLHLAVAASCAIPGYFAPVQIGSRAYVDGGAHSPTNADLLRRRPELDLAAIVAPMSGAGALPTGLNGLLRRHSRRRLRQEIGSLRSAGLDAVTFEPGPAVREVMGDDLLSRERVDAVVQEAYRETLDRARHADIGRGLHRLRGGGHEFPEGA
jgi:NTE family protein